MNICNNLGKSIAVHRRDSRELSWEIERKGWNGMFDRLDREGLGGPVIEDVREYEYAPPTK